LGAELEKIAKALRNFMVYKKVFHTEIMNPSAQ
jgi:hypothetical protein